MFESNNITITGKSAVLSILYTVVTRQKTPKTNKQTKKQIHARTHAHSLIHIHHHHHRRRRLHLKEIIQE